ncbi:MAG: CBS domain-containing protein [Geminicoccaceae bacterium]
MTVAADLMTRDVLTVEPDMPVSDVAQLILKHKVTALPVVDEEGRLLGIVSEGDLVRCSKANRGAHRSWWLNLMTGSGSAEMNLAGQGDRPIGDVMSKDVLLASERESLPRLIELLSRRRIKRLPIVKDGKLVGIVSRVDVLRFLAGARTMRLEDLKEAV